MEPSPKPAAEPVIEEEDEEGGDESEALLGSSRMGKTPDISASSAVKIVPSKDTVKVESEPAKPAVGARAKKPYLNTDV